MVETNEALHDKVLLRLCPTSVRLTQAVRIYQPSGVIMQAKLFHLQFSSPRDGNKRAIQKNGNSIKKAAPGLG